MKRQFRHLAFLVFLVTGLLGTRALAADDIVGHWTCFGALDEDGEYTPVYGDTAYADFYDTFSYRVNLDNQVNLSGSWLNISSLSTETDNFYTLTDDDYNGTHYASIDVDSTPHDLYLMIGSAMLCFHYDGLPERETTPSGSGSSSPQATGHVPTTGEKNALEKAHSYLRVSAFSYTGLIDQLEFSGFTTAEATYAADNCGADWYDQALNKALSYLNVSAFSYTGLIDQLEFSGFTTAEATYGADHCGADWFDQAAKKAESYLKVSSFSRDRLIDQLEFSGFTHEQAVYGASQNGY